MKKVVVMLALCLLSVSLFPQEPVASLPSVKKTVAVLEFEGGSGQDAITIADLFELQLVNKNIFNVLTRTSVNAIIKEHNFQRLNVTDIENIKAISELVNADYIVVGKITMLGKVDLLTVQMLNVVTGQVDAGEYVTFKKIEDTVPYINSMVDNIINSMVGIETAPTTTTYKIGDIGPGGGLVFYINGDKYLESSENLGKADWNDAQELAKNYRGGGYDDWYLPNKEELNYIYENLRKKDFIIDNGWFWSSSEYNNDNVWIQGLINGSQNNYYKSSSFYYRFVRAFY